MSEARFNVVFAGELVPGADPQKVRQNLANAFRMDMTKVEALFSGKRVVVKKDADQATAMKFRAVMKQAGAQCDLEPVGQAAAAPAPAAASVAPPAAAPEADTAPAPAPAPVATSASAGELETVGTIRTGGTGFTGPFDVAPSGTDLAQQRELPPAMVPDLSHLSIAPAGADMGQKKDDRPPVSPDISHLSIKPL